MAISTQTNHFIYFIISFGKKNMFNETHNMFFHLCENTNNPMSTYSLRANLFTLDVDSSGKTLGHRLGLFSLSLCDPRRGQRDLSVCFFIVFFVVFSDVCFEGFKLTFRTIVANHRVPTTLKEESVVCAYTFNLI